MKTGIGGVQICGVVVRGRSVLLFLSELRSVNTTHDYVMRGATNKECYEWG